MKLPNRKNARIKKEKITKYLLSLSHKEGKSKAKFFRKIGFNESNIENFKKALLKVGKSNKVIKVDSLKKEFVIKYIIDGLIDSPKGKQYKVRTIWGIKLKSKIPYLTTAYPDV